MNNILKPANLIPEIVDKLFENINLSEDFWKEYHAQPNNEKRNFLKEEIKKIRYNNRNNL